MAAPVPRLRADVVWLRCGSATRTAPHPCPSGWQRSSGCGPASAGASASASASAGASLRGRPHGLAQQCLSQPAVLLARHQDGVGDGDGGGVGTPVWGREGAGQQDDLGVLDGARLEQRERGSEPLTWCHPAKLSTHTARKPAPPTPAAPPRVDQGVDEGQPLLVQPAVALPGGPRARRRSAHGAQHTARWSRERALAAEGAGAGGWSPRPTPGAAAGAAPPPGTPGPGRPPGRR